MTGKRRNPIKKKPITNAKEQNSFNNPHSTHKDNSMSQLIDLDFYSNSLIVEDFEEPSLPFERAKENPFKPYKPNNDMSFWINRRPIV